MSAVDLRRSVFDFLIYSFSAGFLRFCYTLLVDLIAFTFTPNAA